MTPRPRREPDRHDPERHDGQRRGCAHPDPGRPDPGRRDPGLQPERTRLAWRRTVLSGTVATVLAVRAALHTAAPGRTPGVLAACALCAAAWLGLLATAHHRMRALTTTAPAPLSPRTATVAVLCTAVLAAGAAAVVLV